MYSEFFRIHLCRPMSKSNFGKIGGSLQHYFFFSFLDRYGKISYRKVLNSTGSNILLWCRCESCKVGNLSLELPEIPIITDKMNHPSQQHNNGEGQTLSKLSPADHLFSIIDAVSSLIILCTVSIKSKRKSSHGVSSLVFTLLSNIAKLSGKSL